VGKALPSGGFELRYLYSASALALLALTSSATAVVAQETSAAVRGAVTANGNPVAGATVTITHVPSGSVSSMKTGAEGAFSLSGLRPGGPYTVTVAADGFTDTTISGISITVGQPYNLPIVMSNAVSEIVVSGRRPADALSTTFDQEKIEEVPSINRDIRDIAREDPFASFNPVSRAVTIAGTRPTTNLFSVDGVRFSDNFGLNNGGLPTNRGPVPLDAVSQVSVKVAPYDVTSGDFQGGEISVVLKSGENKLSGSAFYAYSDASLTGDRSLGTPVNVSLTSKDYGAFLSGPIIKDKLFFALSYEKLNEITPQQFGLAGAPSVVPGLTQAEVDQVSSIAKSVYNYTTGGISVSKPETDQKYTAKLDYNFNDAHRMSYTYIHDNGETEELDDGSNSTTTPAIGLQNFATHEPQTFNSHVVQFVDNWTNNFNTETRLNWRKAYQPGISYGGGGGPGLPGFAQFSVCDDPLGAAAAATANLQACSTGTPREFFGVEQFSQADVVGQTSYGANFIAHYNVGNHVLEAQAAWQRLDINNIFVQSALGVYYFDSLDELQNKQANSLTYQNSITGNLKDIYADFSYDQYNFGLQDSWDITPKLNVQYGVRADLYQMSDMSPLNKSFVNRYGTPNNYNLNGDFVWEPRASATWRATDRLSFRAGVGLFNGGAPDVYVGNSFSVAGVFGNTITLQRTSAPGAPVTTCSGIPTSVAPATAASICSAALDNVAGNSIDPIVKAFLQTNTASLSAAPVDALDKNFKVDQTWKFSGSVDYKADFSRFKLGDGWRLGADIYYGKVQEAAYYTDLRLSQTGTAPDGRPIYSDTFDTTNNADFLEKNDRLGHSMVAILRANKAFDIGLIAGISYAYSDITSYADMGGSTASGTYGSTPMVDPNKPVYGTSDYQVRNDVKFNLDYQHDWWKDNPTTIGLYGEDRSGSPYSLTMNAIGATRAVFGVTGTASRFLLYVPNVSSFTADPKVTYDSMATFTALQSYIVAHGLKQGAIIGKNTQTAPDYFKVDMHFEQAFPLYKVPGKIKLYADVENFLNLLDNKWGAYQTVNSLSPLVQVSCNVGCTQYTYKAFSAPTVVNNTRQGLWAVRIGARYEF
jgi:hypothetical protein